LQVYEGFMSSAAVDYREEPGGISSLWPRLGGRASASPKLWMDAYLAAFAIAGGMTLVSMDHGFHAFKRNGLKLLLMDQAR
jgi:predicted nucleic acid-binding protein